MNTLSETITKRPMLTEPGVKYFINETLKQCHHFKEKYQNSRFTSTAFSTLAGLSCIL